MAAAERIELMGVIRQQVSSPRLPITRARRQPQFGSRKLWEFTVGAASEALAASKLQPLKPSCAAIGLSASCRGMFSSRDRSLLKSATFFSSGQAEKVH
jgi:hypothetical protein